jgi:diguanylate cyclase (GGDEF)-like protein
MTLPSNSTTRYSPMAGLDYSALLRTALLRSYDLIRERDLDRLRGLVLADALELLGASSARFHVLGADGTWQVVQTEPAMDIPCLATEMEAELLPRALALERSLISTHPALDKKLVELEHRCRAAGITTHLLLIRAYQQTYGAVAVHWLGKPRPVDYDGRSVFYAYWDNVGLAVATAIERERAQAELEELRQTAFNDRRTGLPNAEALERALEAHAATSPFSVLVLDFDGLRAANGAFGHRQGGDVLIKAVGQALPGLTNAGELPFRLYTAGDEFALLLPNRDEQTAERRRTELEAALSALPVPHQFATIYQGASVGHASRRPGETPGQTLGRAIHSMRSRKAERQTRRV